MDFYLFLIDRTCMLCIHFNCSNKINREILLISHYSFILTPHTYSFIFHKMWSSEQYVRLIRRIFHKNIALSPNVGSYSQTTNRHWSIFCLSHASLGCIVKSSQFISSHLKIQTSRTQTLFNFKFFI